MAHPSRAITGATRIIALLGNPVAHSLSPLFQNAAIGAVGLDAVYIALRCSAADAPVLLAAIARAGGGGNVTVPHKSAVLVAIERPTGAVQRTGACNTFWLEHDRIVGDNTDVAGFDAALRSLLPDPHGARVLLLGAGGAARAAAVALLDAHVARIDLFNRTGEAAIALVGRLDPGTRVIRPVADLHELGGEDFDLVVNATRLGMLDDDPDPCDLQRLGAIGAVLDLVYRRGGTRWIHAARAAGLRAADGTAMLLHQGAAAFERWFGRPAPLEVMRQALSD